MRLKCEAYSTLNDLDEDAQAENSIQERLRSQGIDPPKSIIVAPAALYLTAILECICERVLSSVGRVATRDSSKEAAGTYDLFVAICEDDAIYPIFKGSKVYDAIDSSLKHSSRPQRSKSFSRSERSENRDTDPSQSRSRLSAESATSGAVSAVGSDYHPSRSSMEKGRGIKLFRPSSDRDATLSSDPVSRVTTGRKGFGSQSDSINDSVVQDPEVCPHLSFAMSMIGLNLPEESNFMQDFDDLMRSGDTMKVSLTPDRLRSMETAKQQQQQRQLLTSPRRAGTHEHSRALSAADANGRHALSPGQQYHDSRKPLPQPSHAHVDSIVEDEEPREGVASSPPAAQSRSVTKPDVRVRSVSASGISHGLGPQGPQVTRKPSLGGKNPPPSFGRMGRDPYHSPNNPSTSPRRKRKVQRNRESMDIDAIMNGSEGSESSPDPGDQATQARARPYPVSKATKDLISFLEEGPPPDIQPTRTATVSTVSLTPTTKSAKSGNRLQRMISKLNLSKDDRVLQDSRGRRVGSASAPTTPLVSSVRSMGTNLPPLPPPVKPVPPPVLSIPPPVPLSPPPSSQPSPDDDDARSPASRNDRQPARKMSIRKAVPNWETADQGALAARTRDTSVTSSPHTVHTSSPLTASPTPPTQNGQAQSRLPSTPVPEAKKANGHTYDNHKLPGSDSPVEIPTPTSVLETPSHSPAPRENENGRAEHPLPDASRPRSSRLNRRSMNDEKVNSARRLPGRQPQPPVTPTPSLSESLALDLRKLMSQANTADECRLLLDTILTRAGITTPYSPVLDTTPSDIEPLEKILVHHFLGADPDEARSSHSQPMTTEAVQHPPPSVSGHPPVEESNDLHQSTTTPTNHGSAVHSHHISTVVAVVS
ncbi:hypothetical protein F5888DRAFT_464683 [Russula emetica]|nr:hypothetical protein F5888DRAFT_464683 [Russula emetica]